MKPSDVYIGILDLFGVWLPGAIAVGAIWPETVSVIEPRLEPFGSGALVAAFAVLAYVAGQIAFVAGSRVLDSWYDRNKPDSPDLRGYRGLAKATMKEDGLPSEVVNSASLYKWAESRVRLESAEGAAEIDRAQAASKFFRTMVPVMALVAVTSFLRSEAVPLLASLLLIPISLRRFRRERGKASENAYRFYAAITARERSKPKEDQIRAES